MYQPGELDQLIEVQRKSIGSDGHGGERQHYSTIYRGWAKVKAGSTAESVNGERVSATTKYTVVIYSGPQVLPSDRIKWGNVYFNIISPLYGSSRNLFLELDCEMGTAT